MKTSVLITLTDKIIELPSLFDMDSDGNPSSAVPTKVWDCSIVPNDFSGNDLEELRCFIAFAKTDQFWQCMQALRPGTSKTRQFSIVKNSDGDDPPDISVILANEKPIGVELTDCSPIAAMVEKICKMRQTGGRVPGVSDAQNFRAIEAYMSKAHSLSTPQLTNVIKEGLEIVLYLKKQISEKDIPGNDILLLTRSSGWPDDEFAVAAKQLVSPKNIGLVVLVSDREATII